MRDKGAAGPLILRFDRDHRVALHARYPGRARVKHPRSHVRPRERRRGLRRHRPPQRQEPAHMIRMRMAQHHLRHRAEIDPERLRILPHHVGVFPGVEQQPAPVRLHQRGKAPLPQFVPVRQHRRQDRDLERRHPSRLRRRPGRPHPTEPTEHHREKTNAHARTKPNFSTTASAKRCSADGSLAATIRRLLANPLAA